MSNALSVAVAWGAVGGVFAVYLLSILKRTKAASNLLPTDRQRWMTTNAPNDDLNDKAGTGS